MRRVLALGDPLVLVTSPLSVAFLLAALALLGSIAVPMVRAKREEALKE